MKETRLRYQIQIQGRLASYRLRHFEGVQVRQEAPGRTVLVGCFRDQSALFGLLNWLHSLGVCLISVRRLEETNVVNEEEKDEGNYFSD